jgi:hypothetical protein
MKYTCFMCLLKLLPNRLNFQFPKTHTQTNKQTNTKKIKVFFSWKPFYALNTAQIFCRYSIHFKTINKKVLKKISPFNKNTHEMGKQKQKEKERRRRRSSTQSENKTISLLFHFKFQCFTVWHCLL